MMENLLKLNTAHRKHRTNWKWL